MKLRTRFLPGLGKIADTDVTNFEIADTDMTNFEIADTDTDMKGFQAADTDADTDMEIFQTADTDMNFLKNRGHGHGADKPRTRVSADLCLK